MALLHSLQTALKSTRNNLPKKCPPVVTETTAIDIGEARAVTVNTVAVTAPITLMIHLTIGTEVGTRPDATVTAEGPGHPLKTATGNEDGKQILVLNFL